MAAEQIGQICVRFAVRIKTRPDYEGLIVTREQYCGFSCDGLVVSDQVFDEEDKIIRTFTVVVMVTECE